MKTIWIGLLVVALCGCDKGPKELQLTTQLPPAQSGDWQGTVYDENGKVRPDCAVLGGTVHCLGDPLPTPPETPIIAPGSYKPEPHEDQDGEYTRVPCQPAAVAPRPHVDTEAGGTGEMAGWKGPPMGIKYPDGTVVQPLPSDPGTLHPGWPCR